MGSQMEEMVNFGLQWLSAGQTRSGAAVEHMLKINVWRRLLLCQF